MFVRNIWVHVIDMIQHQSILQQSPELNLSVTALLDYSCLLLT